MPELERPTEAVRTNSAKVEKLKEPPLCMGGTCQSYGSLIKSLIRPIDSNDVKKGQLYLDIRDRKTQYFELQRNCFSGANLIDVLLSKYVFPSGRTEAIEVAIMLMDMGIFHHIAGLKSFEVFNVFYR